MVYTTLKYFLESRANFQHEMLYINWIIYEAKLWRDYTSQQRMKDHRTVTVMLSKFKSRSEHITAVYEESQNLFAQK